MNLPASQRYYSNPRSELAPLLPARYHTVLDIGCASGAFAQTLAPGAEVWGIEPVAAAADQAEGRLHRLLRGTFDSVCGELPLHYFDLVTCNDVIEHMPDHEAFLARVRQTMKPDGVLVGSLPNIRYFETFFDLVFRGEWHYQDMGILDRTHQRFFTLRSIRRTLDSQGYTLDEIQGINPARWRKLWLADRLRLLTMILITGGRLDVRYRQFAFRARQKPGSP